MILILDNRDSFVFNLDQALRALGAATRVIRSDRTTASEILAEQPQALVLSPGPGIPNEAGCLLEVARRAPDELPILGVCLGYHALAEAAGGRIRRADQVFHGRCSEIEHDGSALFAGLANPFSACRYHSLIVPRDEVPAEYEACAWTRDGTVMAMQHRNLPRHGVQFHPESFRTEGGETLIRNFYELTQRRLAS